MGNDQVIYGILILCYFIQPVNMMNIKILDFGKSPTKMKKKSSMDCIHFNYNSVYKILIYTLIEIGNWRDINIK